VTELEIIYRAAEANGIPGDVPHRDLDLPGARNKFGDPMYLTTWPGFSQLKILMAHGGPAACMDTAFFLLRRTRMCISDISGIPSEESLQYFPRWSKSRTRRCLARTGPGRVCQKLSRTWKIFGTRAPAGDRRADLSGRPWDLAA